MKHETLLWQLGGATFAAVLGTLLHFVFGWTDCMALAPVSAVNESTWEHMKILFFPMLFYAVFQSFFFRDTPNFWWIKLAGITLGVLLIPVLFYTLNGVFGKTPDWVNILTFFLADFSAYLLEFWLLKQYPKPFIPPVFALVILSLFAVSFLVFTFYPPKLPLFLDPVTSKYGALK